MKDENRSQHLLEEKLRRLQDKVWTVYSVYVLYLYWQEQEFFLVKLDVALIIVQAEGD